MRLITLSAVAVLVGAFIYQGIHHASAPTFPVHKSGAIVITGASTGIGRDAAAYLAEKRLTVFAGVRKEKDAESLRAMGMGEYLQPILLDVTDESQVKEANRTVSEWCAKENLPLVGLINNAGVSTYGALELLEQKDISSVMDVNVVGLLSVTKTFLPLLRQHQGRIINIGSVVGLLGLKFRSVYAASKFAVEGLSDALRRELLPLNVSVSVIEPGYITTEIVKKTKSLAEEFEDTTAWNFAPYAERIAKDMSDRMTGFKEIAGPPLLVSEVIGEALFAPSPRTRYTVAMIKPNFPAWLLPWVIWAVPDRVLDLLLV